MISKWFSLNPDDIILVGGLEHEFDFPYIGNVIIPTDELIFLRGVGIPPTRYSWAFFLTFYLTFLEFYLTYVLTFYHLYSKLLM